MHTPTLPNSSRRPLHQAAARLRRQFARHQRGAAFWDAYQQIQHELVRAFPDHQTELCDRMALWAQRLGAVERAQLLGNTRANH